MKVLPVDVGELQIALESRDEGFSLHAYWFDVETGEVILLTEDLEEQDELREQIEENAGGRFVRIEPTDSREAFEVMEDFVRSLRPTRMREKLEDALGGRKPFRRFKDTLAEDPIILEQWFKFEEAATLRQAIEWLAELGIQPLDSGPVKDDVVDDDLTATDKATDRTDSK